MRPAALSLTPTPCMCTHTTNKLTKKQQQVSEHASWCVSYYSRIVDAALAAAGAPAGLVSFVTGYGDAGHALVTGGVDKVWVSGCVGGWVHVCVCLCLWVCLDSFVCLCGFLCSTAQWWLLTTGYVTHDSCKLLSTELTLTHIPSHTRTPPLPPPPRTSSLALIHTHAPRLCLLAAQRLVRRSWLLLLTASHQSHSSWAARTPLWCVMMQTSSRWGLARGLLKPRV